jgi:hypothetical protein
MKIPGGKIILTTVVLCCGVGISGRPKSDPFAAIPEAGRKDLATRLNGYVRAYKDRNWAELYSLISEVGKDRVDRSTFISVMKSKHGGRAYSAMPDLEAFDAARSQKDSDGIDIYGCAKAKREGQQFKGVAVMHAVREHDSWVFSGWSFTEFPNQACGTLSDPGWKAPAEMEWGQPMEEFRGSQKRSPGSQ